MENFNLSRLTSGAIQYGLPLKDLIEVYADICVNKLADNQRV
jgi:hypothetical protein